MESSWEDRRKHPRLEFHTDATVLTPSGEIVDGVSSNLSEGGALLASYSPLRSGQEIFFDIRLKHEDREMHIRGRGQVAHAAVAREEGRPPYRSGIQFLDMDTLSAATLETLLAFNGTPGF